MIITRDDVLKAISTENLAPGDWESADGCRVCAVGAVLRGQGVDDISKAASNLTEGVYASSDSLPYALAHRLWLSALSIKYERLASVSRDEAAIRTLLAEWVRETLPDVVYEDSVTITGK